MDPMFVNTHWKCVVDIGRWRLAKGPGRASIPGVEQRGERGEEMKISYGFMGIYVSTTHMLVVYGCYQGIKIPRGFMICEFGCKTAGIIKIIKTSLVRSPKKRIPVPKLTGEPATHVT